MAKPVPKRKKLKGKYRSELAVPATPHLGALGGGALERSGEILGLVTPTVSNFTTRRNSTYDHS